MPLFLTIASLDVVLFNWRKELAATALHLLMIMYRNTDNIVMERTLRLQYTVAAQSRMPLCGESVMKKQSRFIRTLYQILSFPVCNLLRCWFGKWRLGEKMQEIRSKIGKRCHVAHTSTGQALGAQCEMLIEQHSKVMMVASANKL